MTRDHLTSFSVIVGTIIAILFVGGIHPASLIGLSLTLFLVLFLLRDTSLSFSKDQRMYFWLLGLFALYIGISLFYTVNYFKTLTGFIWFLLILISLIAYKKIPNRREVFEKAVVFLGLGTSVIAFILYFSDIASNLRMDGIFFNHNVLAAALFLPVVFSLYAAERREPKLLYRVVSIITISAFILSLSRAAYLALSIAVLICFIGGKFWKLSLTSKSLKNIICILLLALVLSFTSYELKSYLQTHTFNQVIDPFHRETKESNALSFRLEYIKTGIATWQDRPLIGSGFGTYGEVSRKNLKNPLYGTEDPHNIVVRILTETGVFGFIFFACINIFIFHKLYIVLFKRNNLWRKVLAIGILALILHSLVDVDWYFPGLFFVFFLAAFFLIEETTEEDPLPISKSLLPVAAIVVLFSFSILVSHLKSIDADYYLSKGKFTEAKVAAERGLRFNPLQAELHYQASSAAYALYATEKNLSDLDLALREISKASIFDRGNSTYYAGQGVLFVEQGENKKAEESFKKAITLDPIFAFLAYEKLAELYMSEERYSEVVTLVDTLGLYYSESLFKNPFWGDPEKSTYTEYLFNLYITQAKAYEALGDMKASGEAQFTALNYGFLEL